MRILLTGALVSFGFAVSSQANAYECSLVNGEKLALNVLLQGRSIEWSYGVLTGEAVGAGGDIGNPPGHWKNPSSNNGRLYSLYTLTKLNSTPDILIAVQYVLPMQVTDVLLLKNSDGNLFPFQALRCHK